jgi:hypothetical protein
MRRLGWLVVAVAAAACSSGSGGSGSASGAVPLMAGFNPGPAPEASKGFQIVLPIVDNIAPLGSDEYCTDTNVIMPEDTWINASEGFQSETGHHVILFYLTTPVTPSTHLCSNSEMTEFSFGMAPSGGPGARLATLPGNLAVKIPKGAQIVVNHHYLNAGSKNVPQAQSALNVYFADPTVSHTTSSVMVVQDTALSVPVGASTYSIDCTINQPYGAWMFFPHMHNWGTHITVTDTPASTGEAKQLFDVDWQPDYAFDFNSVATMASPSTPFMFNKGDKIHIQCDYMNNTNATMSFGTEMCLMATFTVDPNNVGDFDCNRGVWGSF